MQLQKNAFDCLCKADIFSSANREVLSAVLESGGAELQKYKKGEIIYSADVFHESVGCVISGAAAVRSKDGRVLVNRLFSGDIFGCAVLFLSKERFQNVITAEKQTAVLYIGKDAVTKLMQLDPGFSLSFIKYLSERICFLNKRIGSFTGGTAESRLAGFLLSRFDEYKTFELDLPMSQLAFSLDIGRASLYRALDSICSAGAVEKNGRVIRLVSREILQSFCSGK